MIKNNSNYNEALELFNKKYTHEELIAYLKEGSVIQRQFAALNIDEINSKKEAEIFISNLVGVDGKIREAIALKLVELTKNVPHFFMQKNIYNKFADATIDIDGNVCRLAINSANNIINDEKFAEYYSNEMLNIIEKALDEISKFTFRDKKYKINKQIFKIYWCLEGLINFYPYSEQTKLQNLLIKCSELPEYTIREKCANLINIMPSNNTLKEIKNKLSNDENYYVRKIFE
ncbi:hypothetical protein IKE67_07055 [bacterium]|nr:hypothetical protein [bacterium]